MEPRARRAQVGVVAVTAALYAGFVTSILSSPLTARRLGAADRGLLAFYTALISVVPVVASLGWSTAARVLAVTHSPRELRRITAWLTLWTTIAAGVITLVQLTTHPLHVSARPRALLLLGVALLPFGLIRLALLGVLVGVGRHLRTAAAAVVFPSAANLAMGPLYVTHHLTLWTAAAAISAAAILQAVVSWCLIPHHPPGTSAPRLRWRSVAQACRDSSGVQIADMAVQRADLLFLLPLIGRSELGYYSVASGIATVALPASQALVVSRYRQIARPDAAVGPFLVRVAIASGVVALGVAASAPIIIPFAFGDNMRGAVAPTCISAAGYAVFGLASAASQRLVAIGRGRVAARVLLMGLGLDALVSWALQGRGAVGGALGSLAAYVFAGIVLVVIATREHRPGYVTREGEHLQWIGGSDD